MQADPTPTQEIVRIRGLRKRFGDNEVLKGIDLEVSAGEVVAIIGRSGSGKSTLLRCINGLETFDLGSIEVAGQALAHQDPKAMRALRQQVGMVFQSFNLFPHLSAGRNVMLAPTLVKSMSADDARRKNSTPTRTNCLVDNSSGWPSHEHSPWNRLYCCVMRSPLPWTRNWWARCCVLWSRLPRKA
jgi:polar amino acid transport system ATP-binding protein